MAMTTTPKRAKIFICDMEKLEKDLLRKALNMTAQSVCIFNTETLEILFANDHYRRSLLKTPDRFHGHASSDGDSLGGYSIFVEAANDFSLYDHLPQLAWASRPDGKPFYFNRGWIDYTGRDIANSVDFASWSTLLHPEDMTKFVENRKSPIENQEPYEYQVRLKRHDGVFRCFLGKTRPCFDPVSNELLYWVGTATDIQDQKDFEESLIKAQAEAAEYTRYFEASLNSLTVSVIIAKPPVGEIVFMNKCALKMWKAEKMWDSIKTYEKHVAYHADGRRYEFKDWPMARTIMYQENVIEELTRVDFGDGVRTILKITSRPLYSSDATFLVAFLSTENVTEKCALEEERINLMGREQAAIESSKLKSEFLANMSHEIRTPLNGILGEFELVCFSYNLGMADLIVDSKECPEVIARKASIIKDCGTLLLTIINDILDLSKVEAGKFELNKSPFRLDKVIYDVESILAPIVLEKGIQLVVQVHGLDCSDQQLFLGDSTRIQQILINLVGNAVKFTYEGRVELRVHCKKEQHERVRVSIVVLDTGIGMSDDTLCKIYKPFVQADASNSRTFCGTGLGLSICKHLIDLMDGSIEAKSEIGFGSEFRILLPLPVIQQEDDDSVQAQTLTIQGCFEVLRDALVLVVDDNKINQEIAKRSLMNIGARNVSSADNGLDALTLAKEISFDLILMDCQMPVMDGFETTRAIREYELAQGLDRVPIVALTASALVSDREKCYDAGMDGHISKPFSRESLRNTVRKWISRGPIER